MNKMLLLLPLLLTSVAVARVNPGPDLSFESAECVYTGEFFQVEPLKVNGRELRPVSVSAATLKIKKLVKGKSPICTSYKDEIDIIFSTGRSEQFATGEHCLDAVADKKSYQVALRFEMGGTFVPAGCFGWYKEAK